MIKALTSLDKKIAKETTLIVGGGGAMVLAHSFPLATADIDAIPQGMNIEELDVFVKVIAKELRLPADWLNPYFASFSHTLPADFRTRLKPAFQGEKLSVKALGREDLLIMKCFAHRAKDVPHARALIKDKADTDFVLDHIDKLKQKNVKDCDKAQEFLEDLLEQI